MTAYEKWTLIIAGAGVLVGLAVGIMSHFRSKRQHKTEIRPDVTATVDTGPVHGVPGYRRVMLSNAGPGVAFDVETDLRVARSDGQVEEVNETRPELRPGDPTLLYAKSSEPRAVWGAIVYRDAEKTQYWSACRKDSSRWEREEGAVPAEYLRP